MPLGIAPRNRGNTTSPQSAVGPVVETGGKRKEVKTLGVCGSERFGELNETLELDRRKTGIQQDPQVGKTAPPLPRLHPLTRSKGEGFRTDASEVRTQHLAHQRVLGEFFQKRIRLPASGAGSAQQRIIHGLGKGSCPLQGGGGNRLKGLLSRDRKISAVAKFRKHLRNRKTKTFKVKAPQVASRRLLDEFPDFHLLAVRSDPAQASPLLL